MAEAKEGFDRVFNYVGSNGPYQITLLLIVSLQCIILSWHHLSYVFLGAVPDHWCNVPELEGIGWTENQIRNLSIPMTPNGQGWESCKYYDMNYTYISTLSYKEAMFEKTLLEPSEVKTRYCDSGWSFDTSIYKSTLVTEFQIVCKNRYLVATIQATYMCGVFIGSLILGSLSDRIIGRRRSVLISIVLVQIGGFLASFASTYWGLILYRFLVAFGVAGAYQNCYVLLMEYTGKKSRSTMGMVQQLPFAVGYMLLAAYAYYIRDWQNLQLAFSITGISLLSYFWILPESARWLAVTGRSEKSFDYVMKVAKQNGKDVDPDEIMQLIKSCSDVSKQKKTQRVATFTIAPEVPETRKSCIISCIRKVLISIRKSLSIYLSLLATPEMRKRTLLLWYLFITVDLVYYGVVFDSATLTKDPYLLVFLGGLSEVPAYTVVVPFLAKFGRRPTIVVTFFGTSMATLTIAYVSAEQELLRTVVSMSAKLFITTCFAVIYLLGTELYPTSTRTTGLAAAVFMGRVGSILAPFVVDGMKSVYRDMPNIIFGIICIFSGVISLLLPETNDLEMADQLRDVEERNASNRRKNMTPDVPPNRTGIESVNSSLEASSPSNASVVSASINEI